MKVLLTGGAGYVGSAALRWLLRNGHDPVAYDNLSAGNAAAVPANRLIVGDILDQDALSDALRRHQAEAVMHFAALASVPESIESPQRYWQVNVVGTQAVLDAMVSEGIQKIIFSSTAATYSFEASMPLTEMSPQEPQVPYGSTKLSAERMIRDYVAAYDMGGVILRYFNACGADPDGCHGECRDHETHLIPLILSAGLGHREKVLVYGTDWPTRDGSCVRDYVHTDDLAQAHQKAMEQMSPGQVQSFNLGNGAGTSVLEVLAACEKVAARSIQYELVGRRPGDPATLVASCQKAKDVLGWDPQFAEIDSIVETAWRWHQSHPNGYENQSSTSVS